MTLGRCPGENVEQSSRWFPAETYVSTLRKGRGYSNKGTGPHHDVSSKVDDLMMDE
jgi:hypothetical protein